MEMINKALCPVLLLLSLLAAAPAQALTDTEIDAAVTQIQEYLYTSQDASGAWFGTFQQGPNDGHIAHRWGPTAMAALALIVSGESSQHPKIQKAIDVLAEAEIEGVYPLSMRIHLWSYLPQSHYRGALSNDAGIMLNSSNGPARFNYLTYTSNGYESQTVRIDNSTTQYGILAMWQAAKRGIRIPNGFWADGLKNFVQQQSGDGGWSYRGNSVTSQSMTLAGLTCLYVGQQEIYRDRDTPEPTVAASIDKGLAYLDRNFSTGGEVHGGASYMWYGYERVGLASGRRYFGGKDWFERIATQIVAKNGRYGANIHEAAFDLMFLARGRVPVWINKLEVPGAAWNNRPNDVYFLNSFISGYREHEVNWQVVSVDGTPEEWLNAPLMYLSSPNAIQFTEEQIAKIKQYLDLGGTLLVNPEGRSSSFRSSITDLAKQMYPDLEFIEMPPEHPMANLLVGDERARRRPPIRILSNGARVLMIMPDNDWGMRFQADREPDPESLEHWKYIVNIYGVVTDRGQITARMSSPVVARERRASVDTIKVVTATLGGAALPETDVYQFMKNYMFNQTGFDINVETVPLDSVVASDPSLLHLMGTHAVELTQTEKDAVQAYVESGGTVLLETIGGQGDFASSVSEQISSFVPGQDQQIRTGSLVTGRDLPDGAKRNRRMIYRSMTQQLANPRTDMLMRGYERDRRYPVLVSNEDISLGMLGIKQYGINGYAPQSADANGEVTYPARNLMINILLDAKVAHPGSTSTETEPAEAEPDAPAEPAPVEEEAAPAE